VPDVGDLGRAHDRFRRVRPDPTGKPEETIMSTAIVHRRRPWVPALHMLLAGGAAVIASAVAPTDVSASSAFGSPAFYGCDRTIGSNRC
jgi:hypothetical protein